IRSLFALAIALDATLWLAAVPLGPVSASGIATVVAGEAAIGVVVVILQWRQRRALLVELPIVALLCLGTLVGIFVTLRETTKHQFMAVADGSLSRQAFLIQNNWYYPAFAWANQRLPPKATVVLVDLMAGYYLNLPYLDDWGGARISALIGSPATRRSELANWCRAGVRYAIFDPTVYVYAPHAYRWTTVPGLAARTLFTANGVAVLAVSPCAARLGGETG
ncbi:MAG: hypothetical protein ACRDIE_03475, partial [Chloroflexota bacterium]